MTVHTCCCILFFVLAGLFKYKIEFKNSFENGFGKLEKKVFLSSLWFWHAGPTKRPASSPGRGRSLLPCFWPIRSCRSPAPSPLPHSSPLALGPSPASLLEAVAFSPHHCATNALAPACQRLPPHSIVYLRHLPKMGAELSTPIEIESSSILHPSFDSAPWWLFKPRPHLIAPHLTLVAATIASP
jgi:hypothetical protein